MTITKKRTITVAIITTLFLLAGATLCSSKVYAAESYSYDLANGVKVTADKDFDKWIANPDGNGALVKIHVDLYGEGLESARTYNNTSWENPQEWTLTPDSSNHDTIDIETSKVGEHVLYITAKGVEKSVKFYVAPKRPSNIKFYTTNNAVYFDTMSANPYEYGDYTWVAITDNDGNDVGHWEVKNQNAYKDSNAFTGLEAGKTYKLYLFGYQTSFPVASVAKAEKTLVMGPSTQPKIKSIKTSNVKVKKKTEWNSSKGCYDTRYYTTWKVTVTLSKKAKNNLGIEIHDGVDGIYKAAGKNKTKYTVNMKRITWDKSYKGQTMKYAVRTYNNKTCGAYSPWSAYKSVKVK